MPISVRISTNQDHAAIIHIYFEANPMGIHAPEEGAADMQVYVAEEAAFGRIVGFAVVPRCPLYSFDLVVSPKWQRQGVGHTIVNCHPFLALLN